jgi:8-oxo-dGTP pyrophosphatase MutT (NUDIX family)
MKLRAAVTLVHPSGNRNDRRSTPPPSADAEPVLVVWNRRYLGWTLPGGLVQAEETPDDAAWRELNEETGLTSLTMLRVYEAPVAKVLAPQRGEQVIVYRVTEWTGIEAECETGCPVTWMTVREFLNVCPFRDFYMQMGMLLESLHWRSIIESLEQT